MSTLKKSLTRVRSSLNRTASKLTVLNNNTSKDEDSEVFSTVSSSVSAPNPNQAENSELTMTTKESSEYYSLKYEDIERRNSQQHNRKRNFSLVNSVGSSSQRISLDASEPISRSHSFGSFHDTTDNTIVFHPDDPLNGDDRDMSMLLETGNTTMTTSQNENDSLLPPIPGEVEPPCNNEELSPTFPNSFQEPFEDKSAFPNTLRQDSSSSSISVSAISSRARLISSIRSSVVSQSSSPLPVGNIATISESSPDTNYFSLDTKNVPTLDSSHLFPHNGSSEDDIADAMAISILEKVPHHQELNVDEWAI